jgi:hypothetical protein
VKSRIPAILAGIYAALVALSIVPIFVGSDSLSGVFLVLLGSPWTQLISSALDAINPAWADGMAAGLALGVIGGAINVAIIYFVSSWIVGRLRKG